MHYLSTIFVTIAVGMGISISVGQKGAMASYDGYYHTTTVDYVESITITITATITSTSTSTNTRLLDQPSLILSLS